MISKPVVEDGDEGLPLGVPVVHRRLDGLASIPHLSLSFTLPDRCAKTKPSDSAPVATQGGPPRARTGREYGIGGRVRAVRVTKCAHSGSLGRARLCCLPETQYRTGERLNAGRFSFYQNRRKNSAARLTLPHMVNQSLHHNIALLWMFKGLIIQEILSFFLPEM